uniref:Uncharacterized protein n=1 Tax=Populus trichocarpa TaxID=3694 RepID=A0A2K1YPP6_POPTR
MSSRKQHDAFQQNQQSIKWITRSASSQKVNVVRKDSLMATVVLGFNMMCVVKKSERHLKMTTRLSSREAPKQC